VPVNIFNLTQDRKTLSIDFGADTLTVTYRPNALTPAGELAILRQARADSIEDGEDDDELERAAFNISRQLEAFAELVESWDFMGPLARAKAGNRLDIPASLTDPLEVAAFVESQGGALVVPAGQVVPIRPDCLRLIGSNFLMTVTARINEDMRPNPKRQRR
jgi:hypothetical protein